MTINQNQSLYKARDLIQHSVIMVNKLYLFKTFNRLLYKAVIKYIVFILSRQKIISSICLKGSCARNDYIPGISDIDLCLILNNPTSEEFITLSNRVNKIKQNIIFKYIDLIGEIEVHLCHETNHNDFNNYKKFYSWKIIFGKDFNNFKELELSKIEKVSFAIFKYISLPKSSQLAHPKSQERRLANIAKILNIKFEFDFKEEFKVNSTKLLKEIDNYILAENLNTNIQTSPQIKPDFICPFNCSSFNLETINNTNINSFLAFFWDTENEHFKQLSALFIKFQWKSYFFNTYGRAIDSKETKQSILLLLTNFNKYSQQLDFKRLIAATNFLCLEPKEIYFQVQQAMDAI